MTNLTVYCFRHGESSANAGFATENPSSIPLTDKGVAQAQALADHFTGTPPQRIFYSPFIRAQNTAQPMIAKFNTIPAIPWPIEEFTYLSPERFANTSTLERLPFVQDYWGIADPDRVDGAGAESFNQFMARVLGALRRLAALQAEGLTDVMLFGHGQFFIALRWWIGFGIREINSASMHDFKIFVDNNHMDNTGRLTLSFDGGAWRIVE